MKELLRKCLKVSLTHIRDEQRVDGGFYSKTSTNPYSFEPFEYFPTIFTTALICQSLSNVDDAVSEEIGSKACNFLYRNKSVHWSWNYWQKDSMDIRRAFPDDLDDTACAIDAINRYQPKLINGGATGALAKLLIGAETKLGGPYETWLVSGEKLNKWHDVDLAVNANILNLLSNLNAVPMPLVQYIESKIISGDMKSSYYLDDELILYFIARSKIPQLNSLIKPLVERALTKAMNNPLSCCALISSAIYSGCEKSIYQQKLINLVKEYEAYRPYPIYVEPPQGSVKQYAGSAALSAAFFCEAITAASSQISSIGNRPAVIDKSVFEYCGSGAEEKVGGDLLSSYRKTLAHIAENNYDGKITSSIQALAEELGVNNKQSLKYLKAGSVDGWVAYTIYDDVIDKECGENELCVANYAIRECIANFRNALPNHDRFSSFVSDVLNKVDQANYEDVHLNSLITRGSEITIEEMPDYKDYRQLAMRSWGHIIATTGVFLLADYDLECSRVKLWQKHILHLLIARQLSDDAHDWREDLSRGSLNSASVLLLRNRQTPFNISLSSDIATLSKEFWIDSIIIINELIMAHIKQSKEALIECGLKDTLYLKPLIKVEESVRKTNLQRATTLEFIKEYGK